MRTIELKNNGNKLCRQLMSLIDFRQGNNYEHTHISVRVSEDNIIVSTFCANEFGRELDNENHTRVTKENIPFFTLKKLGMV